MRVDAAEPRPASTPGSASRWCTTGSSTSPTIGRCVLEQQIVVAVNAAADRVLDRQHAVAGRPGLDRGEDLLEAPARQQLRLGARATAPPLR